MSAPAAEPLVLAVNPGAGSTKLALFRGEHELVETTLRHAEEELRRFARVGDELPWRLAAARGWLAGQALRPGALAAVVGRGGLFKPVASGTYLVDEAMLAEAARAARGEHAANLGAPLSHALAAEHGCPAFVVDPVSVDELAPVARYSGLAGIERTSLCHALNMRAVARRHAAAGGRRLEELRLVVAHLGTGASLCALEGGRMVDVVNPMDEGPFSGDRAGGLPATALLALASAPGADLAALRRRLFGDGGLFSYLGTRDVREAAARAAAGDARAGEVLAAMAYQLAKAIGEMAVALAGRVDAVLLTGGAARCEPLVEAVRARAAFVAPVITYPGEDELRALAEAARRALTGEEPARRYG
ncbi:butyrate kinase [Anaeromyxobacter diazotrophicus]|uniref:Probable butyrate kinase n=1 Tax=Anaeromyxobacter diazotrophicus TaxID=2590199 RepID=A0A7I9VN16_9BACT|nr:butyrate kinase [Anaeromyxobacter diazotrophicus]GEJ57806.1 putative butyrate kinase [Anaeromyxobacter diazotrophicus]